MQHLIHTLLGFGLWMLGVAAAPTDDYQSPYPPPRKQCTAHDACWPSAAEWAKFNSSVGGRLIASRPTAAVCHDPTYDAALCEQVKSNWTSGDWRANQVGGYSAIVWELGDEICLPRTSREQPCEQGLVAPMTLDARSVEAIQAGIRFAREHDLYLTVKNTGHDHLGRSSGDGSFAIWTHNIKGREWHDAFIPKGAPTNVQGVSAVTLQPGEEWLDVYHAADEHGVIIAGGSARTVGAVGGYLLAGGHSPWSYYYGLAADNLLEASIATPCGEHVVLNEFTDPEYFWAIRGGGGNSWGVLTSATYQTFSPPSHIQVAVFQANMSSPDAYRTVYTQALKSIPAMTDAGYTGYGDTDPVSTVQFIFLQPNGTNATLEEGFAGFNKILEMNGTDGISVLAGNFTFPTWRDYTDYFLTDPNIATNIQDASRLLTADVLLNKAEDIVDLALRYPDMAAGHNFIGKVNPAKRSQTSVHPIWSEGRTVFSLGVDWANQASVAEKTRLRKQLVQASLDLEEIVGSDGGTYVNEANPYEPDWKNAFWGSNYDRLLPIKRRVDPANLMVCNRCVGTDVLYRETQTDGSSAS